MENVLFIKTSVFLSLKNLRDANLLLKSYCKGESIKTVLNEKETTVEEQLLCFNHFLLQLEGKTVDTDYEPIIEVDCRVVF